MGLTICKSICENRTINEPEVANSEEEDEDRYISQIQGWLSQLKKMRKEEIGL